MPLPDPHANESTVEIDQDTFKQWQEAVLFMKGWEAEAVRLKAKLLEQLGDAFAGTVNGEKVIAYRPKDQWASTRIQKDYPDLVQHFIKYKTEEVFDLDAFGNAHPEILDQYRVRAFTQLG